MTYLNLARHKHSLDHQHQFLGIPIPFIPLLSLLVPNICSNNASDGNRNHFNAIPRTLYHRERIMSLYYQRLRQHISEAKSLKRYLAISICRIGENVWRLTLVLSI